VTADAVNGSTGIYMGRLRSSETTTSVGIWVDIAFKGWELGTIELDVSRSRPTARRDESCPYDDCTARYGVGADGNVKLISDPGKVPAPGISAERYRTVSVAALRSFKKSRYAAPHFLVGLGTLSRQVSFHYDDAVFGTQTRNRKAWGPVAGVGVDVFIRRLVVRVQYRVDPMSVGKECVLICNDQFRVGAGLRF
jgi:hypothetical protein